MEQSEIIEDNKLIAKFMQYDDVDCPNCKYTRDCNWLQCRLTDNEKTEQLAYHSSWDWLIPVVEKIESLDKLGGIVQIMQGQCKITSRMLGDNSVYANKSNYMLMGVKGKLLSVYEAVVEFIKWYNKKEV